MSETVIQIIDLWKNDAGDESGAPALWGINIEMKRGEIIALAREKIGKNTLR